MRYCMLLFLFIFLSFSPSWGEEKRKLAMVWPAGFCAVKKCVVSQLPAYFTIHGVWFDESASGSSKLKYEPNDMTWSLTAELGHDWPGYVMQGHAFWEHEWQDHGKWSGLANVQEYFKKGLRAKNSLRVSVEKALSHYQITPKELKNYTSEEIGDAIYRKTGFIPELRCSKESKNKFILLDHVIFYLNSNFELIDAAKTNGIFTATGCGDRKSIKYIPVPKRFRASN